MYNGGDMNNCSNAHNLKLFSTLICGTLQLWQLWFSAVVFLLFTLNLMVDYVEIHIRYTCYALCFFNWPNIRVMVFETLIEFAYFLQLLFRILLDLLQKQFNRINQIKADLSPLPTAPPGAFPTLTFIKSPNLLL